MNYVREISGAAFRLVYCAKNWLNNLLGEPWMWQPQEISQLNVGQWNSHGAVLKERPRQAEKIAVIISCWSNTERLLAEIIVYVLGVDGTVAAKKVEKAHILNKKLPIVLDAVRANLPAELRAIALNVLEPKELQKIANIRHKLAHCSFITLNKYPSAVVTRTGFGRDEHWHLYTDEGLQSLVDRFEKKLNDVATLYLQIASSVAPIFEPGRMIFPHQTWALAPPGTFPRINLPYEDETPPKSENS